MKTQDAKRIIENVVKSLPAKYRKTGINILHEIVNENKKPEEVAKELNLPTSYIYNVLKEFHNIGKNYKPEDFT